MIPVHWGYLAVMRATTGFGASACTTLAPLLVADALTPAKRGCTLMGFSVGINIGLFISYGLHALIELNYAYYYFTFLPQTIYCVVGVALSTNIHRVLRRMRRKQRERSPSTRVLPIDVASVDTNSV